MRGQWASVIFMTGALTACGPVMWNKPGVSQAQFNAENAQCQMGAAAANSGEFVAVGKPAAVAGAAIGNAIGTAIAREADYRKCMQASGYAQEKPQVAARITRLKTIIEPTGNCTKVAFFSPDNEPMRRHTMFDAAELTPAQLSDPAMASPEESAAVQSLHTQAVACRQKPMESLAAEDPGAAMVFRDQASSNEKLIASLRARQITWGQYNARQKDAQTAFANRLQAMMAAQ